MNSDFNFKPTSQPNPLSNAPEPDGQTGAPASARARQVISSDKQVSSGGFKKFLGFLLVLILMAAAAAGMYYWQQTQVQNLQASKSTLESQVTALQAQVAKQKGASTTMPTQTQASNTLQLIPAQVDTPSPTSATIGLLYKQDLNVSEVWVEYGAAPDKLDQASKHESNELGLGQPQSYMSYSVPLSNLQSGTRYYYRVAGKAGNNTVYSSVASFQTSK